MAKTCTYTILAPGGNLTTTVDGRNYTHAAVYDHEGRWIANSLHRDMRSAMGKARSILDRGIRAKVVEAVLTSVDGVPIPGAVERRMQEKVDRLRANADRIFERAASMKAERRDAGANRMLDDFKAYHRWIAEIKTQIKTV